jgi:hypothetical protein
MRAILHSLSRCAMIAKVLAGIKINALICRTSLIFRPLCRRVLLTLWSVLRWQSPLHLFFLLLLTSCQGDISISFLLLRLFQASLRTSLIRREVMLKVLWPAFTSLLSLRIWRVAFSLELHLFWVRLLLKVLEL